MKEDGPIGRELKAAEPVAAEPVAAEPVAARTIGRRTFFLLSIVQAKIQAKLVRNIGKDSKRDRQEERLKENGTIRDNTGHREVGFGWTRDDTTYDLFLRKKVGTTQSRFHYHMPSSNMD